jgi:hypothetical protein
MRCRSCATRGISGRSSLCDSPNARRDSCRQSHRAVADHAKRQLCRRLRVARGQRERPRLRLAGNTNANMVRQPAAMRRSAVRDPHPSTGRRNIATHDVNAADHAHRANRFQAELASRNYNGASMDGPPDGHTSFIRSSRFLRQRRSSFRWRWSFRWWRSFWWRPLRRWRPPPLNSTGANRKYCRRRSSRKRGCTSFDDRDDDETPDNARIADAIIFARRVSR